jgi:DinB family protein
MKMISPAAQTDTERKSLLQLLRRTEMLYLATLEGVSPAQAVFKPGPDRWSIAEIAEHVAAAEEFIYKLATAASPSKEQSDPQMDEKIHRGAADRRRTFVAPERVRPYGRFDSIAQAAAAFSAALQKTIVYVEQSRDDLRRLRLMHPAAGSIDVYQNLLIMAYHPERHAKQIEEVKSSEGYPK